MTRLIILSAFIFSLGMFAHNKHDEHYGAAIHIGSAEVFHEGDFIDFTFNFEAACYGDRETPRAHVVANVENFVAWLTEQSARYGDEALTYTIDLINVWRNHHPYNEYLLCENPYTANQRVTVTLHKPQGERHLEADLIQQLFGDMQMAIATLNHVDDVEPQATITAAIGSVNKGISEETVDELRVAAKAKAQRRATQDFLAFLGPDYHGTWHLHSVNFGNDSPYSFRQSMEMVAADMGNQPSGSVLSALKLEPISYSVEGNFHFHFELVEERLP